MRDAFAEAAFRFHNVTTYLLSSSRFGEVRLGHNLDGIGLVGVQGRTQIHLGETTFSEQSAAEITMKCKSVSIDPAAFLLDYDTVFVQRGIGWHRVGARGQVGTRHLRKVWFRSLPHIVGGTTSSHMSAVCGAVVAVTLIYSSLGRSRRSLKPLVTLIVGRFESGKTLHLLGIIFLGGRVVAERSLSTERVGISRL
jgi:hypothetical protein